MSIAVVGCGVAGTLVCLELLKEKKSPNEIYLIDPHYDGGALGRHWGGIYSNTRWEQITESMRNYPSSQKTIEELNTKYTPESRVILSDLGYLIQKCTQEILKEVNFYVDKCKLIQETNEGWTIYLTSDTLMVSKVIICQGGQPKLLDFGKPILPLEIALDPARLPRIVRSSESVAVFGMAHSGTLTCKHLLDLGIKVYGIYKTEKPFRFDRDGAYDGIKQESAEIADRLLQAPPHQFELIKYQDTQKLVKVLSKVSWIVSAIGFDSTPIHIVSKEQTPIPWTQYSPETSELTKGLYGFGLAYPGVTRIEGQDFKDVSIPSFLQQIRRCLPSILSKS